MSAPEIRKASIEDASLILKFVKELAVYEKALDQVITTVADIEQNLFDNNATTEAIICSLNGVPVGFDYLM